MPALKTTVRQPCIAFVIYCILMGLNSYVIYKEPRYNWDLLAYLAVAQSYKTRNIGSIHKKVYEAVEKAVPEERYLKLIGQGAGMHLRSAHYRSVMASNSNKFAQQLPFYSVKPIYPLFIAALHFLGGIDLVDAARIISIAGYLAIGFLIYAWLVGNMPPFACTILSYSLSSLPFITKTARLFTPDVLSGFTILLASFLFWARRRTKLALVIMVLSIGIRPDNIIFVGLILIYVWVCKDTEGKLALTFGILAAVVYMIEVKLSGNYGYKTLFYHTFVKLLTDPASFNPHLSASQYLRIYKDLILNSFLTNELMLFGYLAVVTALGRYAYYGMRDRYLHLVILSLLFLCVHFFLFPYNPNSRMYMGAYIQILIVLAVSAGGPIIGQKA